MDPATASSAQDTADLASSWEGARAAITAVQMLSGGGTAALATCCAVHAVRSGGWWSGERRAC